MVYRAHQLNMEREVAVKILPPRFLAIPDVVERFKREAQLASRLRHRTRSRCMTTGSRTTTSTS